MKFSLHTIKQFIDFDLPPIEELAVKIGTQLGAVDEVISIGEKYRGIVLVQVISCEPHKDADKLKVCTIDDGDNTPSVKRNSNGHVQVVCGAPNCREGLTVAWLPPGATVPSTADKDPLVLEAREIRGVVSNGMLASPKELGLGDNHEGILEINSDHKPGTDFAEAFGLKDDVVLDIENKMFTHRPDCFGFMGIARELAGIQNLPFKSPDWYLPNPTFPGVMTDPLKLKVSNELPELVPRFTAITMSSVKVGQSPVWLQVELAKVGQKSINNIVDYTNYFMLATGQPLHAYDYDKVKALSSEDDAAIVIRNPRPGEKLKLLNGKTIEPRAEAIMIATDKQLIGLGGVMGGADTEVDEGSNNIILECANFDMYSIRRTSMIHGLFTDAVTRFTKGQSPLQNLTVLNKITNEIIENANGKAASDKIDDNHLDKAMLDRNSVHLPVTLPTEFINSRLGLQLSAAEIKTLLENVELSVDINGDELTVKAPFWRTDIELREDVVEEVGRLHGFDKLPLELPERDLAPTQKDPLFETKAEIRERLSRAGANEVLNYSFVPGVLFKKTNQDPAKAFRVANALSPELQYYRMSLVPSLLDKVHANIKAGYEEFALFEIGKTHSIDHPEDEDGLPAEYEFTALVITANDKLRKPGAAYYEAVKYLDTLAGGNKLSFTPIGEDMQQYDVTKPYNIDRAALVSIKDGDFLGIVGEFMPSVARSLKLPKHTAGFEVDTTVLQKIFAAGPSYSPLHKFPGVKQDITLKVPADTTFSELNDFINQHLSGHTPDNSQARLEPVDIYQKEDDQSHKNITFRITLTGSDRTHTDKEAGKVLDSIAEAAKTKLKAERI